MPKAGWCCATRSRWPAKTPPALIIDFATLTGAARVALGPQLPALFANDEALAADFEAGAKASGDPLWRLPLWPGYRDMLKSNVADMVNSAEGGFAGAITAALFLEAFVPKDTPWAHFDTFAWTPVGQARPAQGRRGARAARVMGGGEGALRKVRRMSELTARLRGPRPRLDPRANVFRGDFADVALAGELAAHHYVEPLALRCRAARTPVRKAGDAAATAVSELLFGEDFDLFDVAGRLGLRPQRRRPLHRLGGAERPGRAGARADPPHFGAHRPGVRRRRHQGAGADGAAASARGSRAKRGRSSSRLQAAALSICAMSRRRPQRRSRSPGCSPARPICGAGARRWASIARGWCRRRLPPPAPPAPAIRTSSWQRSARAVAFDDRAAGDLVFFPGHVGILASRDRLFHANAHWMATVEEPLEDVIARLVASGVETPVTGVKRLA